MEWFKTVLYVWNNMMLRINRWAYAIQQFVDVVNCILQPNGSSASPYNVIRRKQAFQSSANICFQ